MGVGIRGAYAGSAIQAGYSKIGTFTGDGNATQAITLPFQADIVEVITTVSPSYFIRYRAFPDANSVKIQGPSTIAMDATGITAIGATSFTIALGSGLNGAGVTHYYRAMQGGVFP